jgi:NADPH-dependent 2,4-dienoyl-CoA reductase/sulfur reductase-like enzyme
VGREKEYVLKPTASPKKVAVIGGGMGGMEVAITLKARGHKPILIEENDHLGGQFIMAGLAPRKEEMRDAAISRGDQTIRAGVDVRLNTSADAALLDKIGPDAIVNATGSIPITLNIPGSDGPNVYSSFDVLSGRATLNKKAVAVVGGGLVGLEVAEFLAAKGCDVTVIEMLDAVGKDIGQGRSLNVMEGIAMAGIKQRVGTKCISISPKGVHAHCVDGDTDIAADAVVIAVGSKPRDTDWLDAYSKQKGIPYYVIGDAAKPRRAIDAIHEAAEVARSI